MSSNYEVLVNITISVYFLLYAILPTYMLAWYAINFPSPIRTRSPMEVDRIDLIADYLKVPTILSIDTRKPASLCNYFYLLSSSYRW